MVPSETKCPLPPMKEVAEPKKKLKWLRLAGFIMSLISAAIVALGIADVTNNYFGNCCKCTAGACSQKTAANILTWVAVGIWAALVPFFTGLYAIYISPYPTNKQLSRLQFWCFISALVFILVIILICCLELGFKFSAGLNSETIGTSIQKACLAIPLMIIMLAVLLLLLCWYMYHCCQCKEEVVTETKHVCPPPAPLPCPGPPAPARACVYPPPVPAQQSCCNVDSEHLNIWAWKRWTNYQPPKRACCHQTVVPACPAPAPAVAHCSQGAANSAFYQSPRVVLAGDGAGASAFARC